MGETPDEDFGDGGILIETKIVERWPLRESYLYTHMLTIEVPIQSLACWSTAKRCKNKSPARQQHISKRCKPPVQGSQPPRVFLFSQPNAVAACRRPLPRSILSCPPARCQTLGSFRGITRSLVLEFLIAQGSTHVSALAPPSFLETLQKPTQLSAHGRISPMQGLQCPV